MRTIQWLLCGLAAVAAALPAAAQDYPTRPVKIVVPYAPGGATDVIARVVAQRLGESLGQNFVVENRPGASGNLALESGYVGIEDAGHARVDHVVSKAGIAHEIAHDLSIGLAVVSIGRRTPGAEGAEQRPFHRATAGAMAVQQGPIDVE